MSKVAFVNFICQRTGIPETKAEEIVASFRDIHFEKDEFILEAGKISDRYLFLSQGCIRAYTLDLEGNEVTTNFYTSGDVVFEVSSFFRRIPSSEFYQAETPCEACYIHYQALNEAFHAMPHFRDFGRAMLVNSFADLKERTLALINEEAETRYDRLIRTKPDIFKHAPLKHIASYLGITDSSLSRIRRNYSQKQDL
ncbi:MAG: Crp/Fnr family transcriptional regulator [Bacteroidia bacterium]